jgi:hypothetical protein
LKARYHGVEIDVDETRFALHVQAHGIDVSLPLAPLQHSCVREPERAGALIADYVASVEAQLTPRSGTAISLGRLMWCVRSDKYLQSIERAAELMTHRIGAGMSAFVAEDLPASIMRGVPRVEWVSAGLADDGVRDAADANTARRFTKLIERIRGADRIPGDGWRMAGDTLFQGSVLMAPDVLRAFAERAGGDVLIGVPDRSVALAIPAAMPAAARFSQRVLREWREAMNPCSRDVLLTDGESLRPVPRRRTPAAAMILPWLGE